MKIRKFVSLFWLVLMFVLVGFSSFYIITGENILTGQKRDGAFNVLDATDQKDYTDDIQKFDSESDTNSMDTPKDISEIDSNLLLFREIVSVTGVDKPLLLESASGGEAIVNFYFGQKASTYYVAVTGAGFVTEGDYVAWLVDSQTNEYLKLDQLEKIDDSDVLKLSFSTEDDISIYNTAVITLEDTDSNIKEYSATTAVYTNTFALADFIAASTTPTVADEEDVLQN